MTHNLGDKLAFAAVSENGHTATINEMFAFEQACGTKPEKTFYHYPLTSDEMAVFNQHRLVVKHRDGRLCLSRRGRRVAQVH